MTPLLNSHTASDTACLDLLSTKELLDLTRKIERAQAQVEVLETSHEIEALRYRQTISRQQDEINRLEQQAMTIGERHAEELADAQAADHSRKLDADQLRRVNAALSRQLREAGIEPH